MSASGQPTGRLSAPDTIARRVPSSSRRAVASCRPRYRPCLLSMNGCGGDEKPVGICETRTLPAVSAPDSAISELKSAISALNADPPRSSSGIIRLEVPVRQRGYAIDWLQAQEHLPRCYFSGKGDGINPSFYSNRALQRSDSGNDDDSVISVAGVGSAVFFQRYDPFSLQDWKSIKRFLSKKCPLIRAYGAMRFDPRAKISSEWEQFGSFYFIVPQVEFDELEESSLIATTIAWDNNLLWPWKRAVDELQATLHQITPRFDNIKKSLPRTAILCCHHFPTKESWDNTIKHALQLIKQRNSELVKVVLARCSEFVTDSCIDPVALLSHLQAEGQNTYQFYLQPPKAPAFIGNTPEQLFHRKHLNISSEALAGTRPRGLSELEDFQIGQDLLFSPKDDIEFTIVRESIRRKLEIICYDVHVEPVKALRKLPRVQHLSAQFSGRLRNEDDEFEILASLHPSPAVCGLPREEARRFIEENEIFDRGMYAGPVGWFGGKESEFAVGIRSALIGKGSGTLIYAGAGIVQGTNPTSEWEELDLKGSQYTKLLQHQEYTLAMKQQII